MNVFEGKLSTIRQFTNDVYILTIDIENEYCFIAGQYCSLQIPNQTDNAIEHYFSIASSPKFPHQLEFCIRTYGPWTETLTHLPIGTHILVSEPKGKFILPPTPTALVFLAGGLGIAPVMSILRSLTHSFVEPITILYGNRTEDTILYKDELENMCRTQTNIKVFNILSEDNENKKTGRLYGFITREIITKKVNIASHPLFYVNGPPIFVEKMMTQLQDLDIPSVHCIKE